MAGKPLAAWFGDGFVDTPGAVPSTAHPRGKVYRVKSPDAKTGLWLTDFANLAVTATTAADVDVDAVAEQLRLDDDQELDLMRTVLGDTLKVFVDDGVPWTVIQKLNQYFFILFAMGEDMAERMVAALGEAAPPNRAARRKASKGSARKTSKQGSTGATPALKAAKTA